MYRLEDTAKVEALFQGWEETLIYSCLQKVMGDVWVNDLAHPTSALASVGCFCFLAGAPDRKLFDELEEGFHILVPKDQEWADLIEKTFSDTSDYRKVTRYAIKKDTVFDRDFLEKELAKLPEGYEIKSIDSELYDLCLTHPSTEDFVSSFASKEDFLKLGRGVVILKDGTIASGAASYSRYREGIEIEVDTVPEERCKGLASIACAALILQCLKEGLYPSWDAQNQISVHLAEKLGYEFSHEYVAYEVVV